MKVRRRRSIQNIRSFEKEREEGVVVVGELGVVVEVSPRLRRGFSKSGREKTAIGEGRNGVGLDEGEEGVYVGVGDGGLVGWLDG